MIQAADSELALIGCAMYDREACAEAFERLRPEHFSEPTYAAVWDFLRTREAMADPVLVANALSGHKGLEELGGLTLLCDAVDRANLRALPGHIEAVTDAAMRRDLDALAKSISTRALKEPGESEDILADLEFGAAEIARAQVSKAEAAPVGMSSVEMVESAIAGRFLGTPTGLASLDHVTGGIKQDDVWFVAGRTSMGKSVVAVSLARLIAQQGRGVFFFSLEMPLREVQARLVADTAYDRDAPYDGRENVRYGDILRGRGSVQQQDRARQAARQIASLPMVVNDRGGLTIETIRAQALRQVRGWERMNVKPGALIIDHIGLVRAHTKRNDSKAAETADIVNELKALAKAVGAPVICLVQVNRATESRDNKRPTLSDLNWSGAIEQIADVAILLYREAYYLERSTSREDQDRVGMIEHELEMIIAKNRSGPICTKKLFVDVASNAVRDLETETERRFA